MTTVQAGMHGLALSQEDFHLVSRGLQRPAVKVEFGYLQPSPYLTRPTAQVFNHDGHKWLPVGPILTTSADTRTALLVLLAMICDTTWPEYEAAYANSASRPS